MAALQQTDILQAVYDEHSEYCRRKIFSDMLNEGRCLPFFGKHEEGKEPGRHSAENTETDGNELLCKCHIFASLRSKGFLNAASNVTMVIIVGIMKESAPKIRRHKTDTPIPI